MNWVIGIDPGINGALVATNGERIIANTMPLIQQDKNKNVWHAGILLWFANIADVTGRAPVYLERAVPFGQGATSAFSYGRGFESLVLSIEYAGHPMTLVEPGKWTKEMHEGISKELKPKVKSLIAAKRLFPKLVAMLPTRPKGGIHDGMIDALLIAGYGLRKLGGQLEDPNDVGSFF